MDGNGSAPDLDVEEVRLVLALNGGVSLAVWMGGVAVELDCARRSHLALAAEGAVPPFYECLCRAFGRQLVIDIMSGASAGGINGALLGAAIVHRRRLSAEFVREKWLELGDFGTLLQRTTEPAPESLMQGDRFTDALRTAFVQLIDGGGAQSTELPPGQEDLESVDVKLDVTTTDVVGERHAFRDAWGRELTAREHRARFRFRDDEHYDVERLATAARASASFPFAFEPVEVSGEPQRLAGLSGSRWALDGGLLDNAPIAAALALVPTRSAPREVQRYVLYVNADPPADRGDGNVAAQPTLRELPGAVVNLPRQAPFVDHLSAIEKALRPALLGDDAPLLRLLLLDRATLETTAAMLLPTYRRRRRLQSLGDLVGDGHVAEDAGAQYRGTSAVAWLPADLSPTDADGAWQWGIAAAVRVLHVLLDVVRRALDAAPDEQGRRDLLLARRAVGAELTALYAEQAGIDGTLAELDELRRRARTENLAVELLGPVERVAVASELVRGIDALAHLRAAGEAVRSVAPLLDVPAGEVSVAERLFGDDAAAAGPSPELPPWFSTMLRRTLAIEVVRRALGGGEAEVETTQQLRFAQLTPCAPTPILEERPVATADTPRAPADKLTGIGLSHFAGFYRRSWRVNDFMWGRLDAAARIADMLVSPERAAKLPPGSVAATLIEGLLPAGADREQVWLVEEALAERGALPATSGDDRLEWLRDALRIELEADLALPAASPDPSQPGAVAVGGATAGAGSFTRAVCARAAQLEVLRQELGRLVAESAADAAAGAGAPPLTLTPDDLQTAIRTLRGAPSGSRTLPQLLTAEDEASSALALRTGAHAGLVGLGMLRTTELPLVRGLFGLRALLLPVAGSVAVSGLARLTVVVAYWAAALLLTSSLLTTDADAPADLEQMSWAAGLSTLIALGVVVGVVFVPGLRARLSHGPRRWRRGALAALLLACGGAIALVLALASSGGGMGWSRAIVGAGAERPPSWLLWLVVAFVIGGPISAIPSQVRGRFDSFLQRPWGGGAMFAAVIALACAVGACAGWRLVESIADDGGWWRWAAGLLALVAAPLLCTLQLFVRRAPRAGR